MKYISVFSGIEAASVAFEPLGWEPVAFSEVAPFPCAVLRERFPDVPNLGDITKVNWKPYRGKADLVVGGSPCFPAGTLVMRSDGYVPIEEIRVGDLVVTHKGRLKRVLATGSRVADTIVLRGAGTDRLECTENHPFFSTEKIKTWFPDERQYRMVPTKKTSWVSACDMQHRYWLNVCSVSGTSIPPLAPIAKGCRGGGYIDGIEMGEDFFYFVGRWLGDGWANFHARKGRKKSLMKRVYVCCAKDKADYLEKRLSRTGLHFYRNEERTTTRFTVSSTQLYDWITKNFGVRALGKRIPAWCLGMNRDLKKALFDGYIESDGCTSNEKLSSTSINKGLCLGMKAIAGSLGYASCLVRNDPKREAIIDGRHVNEHHWYRQQYEGSPRSSFFFNYGWFGLVRKVLPGRSCVTVYNIEVEDDNSYLADGIAVHNCQSFSVAGKREGLSGESGLMFEFIRCVREVRPRWFLWENVPGALSVERGKAFGQLLSEMADGGGYGCAWRVLDAQFFGVAQRRRRLFLVGRAGNGFREACQVLFEPEGLQWDSPSNADERKALAGCVGCHTKAAGFCNDSTKAGSIVFHEEHAATLRAGSNLASTGAVISVAGNERGEGRIYGDGTYIGAITANGSAKQFQAVLQSDAGGSNNRQAVTMVTRCGKPGGGKGALISDDVSLTLSTRNEQILFDGDGTNYVVRRLTPTECERLQGFPDGWTKVKYRGKPADECPDGPRYKALGNSMAVPVMRWIGRRIQMVDE